jgi:integrase
VNKISIEAPAEKREPLYKKVGENLYRHTPSDNYYALLKRGGKQFRRSLKTSDRALASRRLADLRKQVNNLTLSDERNCTFADVAKVWLNGVRHALKPSSIQRREICINGLTPFFKGVALRSVNRQHCDNWLNRRGKQLSPSSFAQELDTLKLILAYAVQRGFLLSNPASDIRRRKLVQAKITVPTRDQFQELIAALRDEDNSFGTQGKAKDAANLVELLAYSGCRLAEATSIRWIDVNFARQCVTVTGGEEGTKNHERRNVPMTASLRLLLERLQAEQNPQPQDFVSSINDAKKALHRACRKLEFPPFTHHDFRHFFATTCIESGVDIPTVSRWLGHKDGGALAMKVYGHLREEHSFSMVKRVIFVTEPASNIVQMAAAATSEG